MNLNSVISDRHPAVAAIDRATDTTIPNPINFLYVPLLDGNSFGKVKIDKAALDNSPNHPFGIVVLSDCHSYVFPLMNDNVITIIVMPMTPVAIRTPKIRVF